MKRVRRPREVSYVVLMMNTSVCMEGEISQPSHAMILIMLSFSYVRTMGVNTFALKK